VDAEGDTVDCRGGSGKEEHAAEVDVEAEAHADELDADVGDEAGA
jgi:hypothetical protein